MQRVLITGATGLVGQEIVKYCHAQNIAVNYLSTRVTKIQNTTNYKGFYWNPKKGEIDLDCFKDVQVIINLAGASVVKRWTKKYKKEILNSRLQSLDLLYKSLDKYKIPIEHLLSAGGISIYPDSRTNYYEEHFDGIGNSFLAKVTEQWEDASKNFENLNVNVSIVRIGLVLSNNGGALPMLVKPIKYFLGSSLGKGGQWQSWIHIEDLAQIFVFLLKHQHYGVFNAVAPNVVKQRELTKTIAKVLNRPLFLPRVPLSVLKLVLGEMSDLVLESQRVSSEKITGIGFSFNYHYLQRALEDLLKQNKKPHFE